MGQAVADLPDPLDSLLSPPTSASGTDDLLSQLAGDEIDRLLAEADADRAPAPQGESSPVAPAPVGTTPAAPTPSEAELDGLLNALTQSGPAPTAPETAAAAPPEGPAIAVAVPPVAPAASDPLPHPADDELDALLNQLNQAPGLGTAPKSLTEQVPDVLAQFGTTVAPADDKIPSPELPASGAGAMDTPDAVMSVAERDALSLSNLADEADAAERQDAEAAALSVAGKPGRFGGLAIRLLELINAPAAAVPDATRDLLGKAAILTLVNSLAVLVYVLFFRR